MLLIKLIDARRGLHNECVELFSDPKIAEAIYRKLCDGIEDCETVDAESIKYGRWIDKGWNGDWQFQTDGRGNCWHEWKCSECEFITKGAKWNFCPNCGARMINEAEK